MVKQTITCLRVQFFLYIYLGSDKESNVYQHLEKQPLCKLVNDASSFTVLDTAHTQYKLGIKEALYIKWLKPNLNKQKVHSKITLILWLFGGSTCDHGYTVSSNNLNCLLYKIHSSILERLVSQCFIVTWVYYSSLYLIPYVGSSVAFCFFVNHLWNFFLKLL